uniref:7TM GPCR serpentine receptor class x (Srx) domain-containing protein n=1 Tax=Acrobeloides nanus TaxID=290746 RepID=A0A914DZL3_9BILA
MASWTHPTLGMGLYLFYPDDWERIFYTNCTLHEMPSHSNIPIGALYVAIGVFCEFTDNRILVTNSICIVPILGIAYTTMCIALFVRTHVIKNHANISKLQRIMLYQSMCICWEIFFVATVYVSNALDILHPPNWFMVFEQLSWVFTHADTPIVYMLFNATLRRAVMSYIKDFFVAVGQKPVRMVTSIYNPSRVNPETGFLSRPT